MKLGILSSPGQGASRARDKAVASPGLRSILLQIGGQLAGIATVLALWPHVDQRGQLLAWWLGLSASQALLLGLERPLEPTAGRADDAPLRSYFSSAGAIISGSAWGSLALVGPYHASPQAQAILFVVLCSMALAGGGFIRHARSAYAAFVSACLLPLFILSVVNPPSAVPAAGPCLLAFAVFALSVYFLQFEGRQRTTHHGLDAVPPVRNHQAMLDNARAAILLSRGHRLEVCNPRFAELMRDTEHGLAGTRLARSFASRAEWRRHALAATETIRRGGTYHGSAQLRRRDGSLFWAELTGQAVDPEISPPQVVWVAFDITDRMLASARDELMVAQLHALIGQSADWYWQTDPQHRLTCVTRHTSARDDTLERNLGRKWWQLHRPGRELRAEQAAAVRTAFEAGRGFRNLQVELPDGARPPLWLSLNGTPRLNEHGAFLGHHGIAVDITEQVRSTERIRHLAYHDALTGLPNRRLLTDRLDLAIARAQRHGDRVGLILVDLDDFRRINDLGGHAAGDQALLETADRLRQCVRASDTVARLGSDEFVVLLDALDDPAEAQRVAAAILSTVNEPLTERRPPHPVGTSIGVATFPEDAGSADELIKVADMRMFRAKRRGGARIESRDGGTPATVPHFEVIY